MSEPLHVLLDLARLVADPDSGNDPIRDAAIDVLNEFDVHIPYEEFEDGGE